MIAQADFRQILQEILTSIIYILTYFHKKKRLPKDNRIKNIVWELIREADLDKNQPSWPKA